MQHGPRRSPLKTYLVPIILSVGFVLVTPLGLFVIFLSGDSCCGENTSGTMLAVTAGIVALCAVAAVLVSVALKLVVRRTAPDFNVLVATAITAGPAAAIYVVFVLFLVATSF